jgi:sugar lactone lactonase YvrE
VSTAEQITDPLTYHGEGAVWFGRDGVLHWVDMYAGDVLTIDDGGIPRRRHVADTVVMLRPRRRGGAVIATASGFAFWDGDAAVTPIVEVALSPGMRLNEGGCTPDGDLLCGALTPDGSARAALYRLGADGTARVEVAGVRISNGLGFTADGACMYYVDTLTRRVDRFEVDAGGALSGRRPHVRIPAADGYPDGLCVDAEDGVWVAFSGGSCARHFDSEGRLTHIVEVPARQVTSVALGGADRRTLYLTTSREGLDPDDDPLAGALFSTRVEVPGVETLAYAG